MEKNILRQSSGLNPDYERELKRHVIGRMPQAIPVKKDLIWFVYNTHLLYFMFIRLNLYLNFRLTVVFIFYTFMGLTTTPRPAPLPSMLL